MARFFALGLVVALGLVTTVTILIIDSRLKRSERKNGRTAN